MDTFIFNDGGRAEAGYKGQTGDCVCRSICIVTGKSYDEVYQALAEGNFTQRKSKHSKKGKRTAANGINTKRKWFNEYMVSLGFKWVPTMFVGVSCGRFFNQRQVDLLASSPNTILTISEASGVLLCIFIFCFSNSPRTCA